MGDTQNSVAAGLDLALGSRRNVRYQSEVGKLVSSIRDIAEATHEQSVAITKWRAAESESHDHIETDQAVQGANRTVDELSGVSKGLYGLVERFRL